MGFGQLGSERDSHAKPNYNALDSREPNAERIHQLARAHADKAKQFPCISPSRAEISDQLDRRTVRNVGLRDSEATQNFHDDQSQ